jgi:hypothetical protein
MARQDSLYEKDFYAWTQWQVKALASRAASELDWENLRRELECLGRKEYRELVSRLAVLLGHLLKWELQPEHRCRSWFLTIREQRRAIQRHLKRSPSLRSLQEDALADGFEGGVDLALRVLHCLSGFSPTNTHIPLNRCWMNIFCAILARTGNS